MSQTISDVTISAQSELPANCTEVTFDNVVFDLDVIEMLNLSRAIINTNCTFKEGMKFKMCNLTDAQYDVTVTVYEKDDDSETSSQSGNYSKEDIAALFDETTQWIKIEIDDFGSEQSNLCRTNLVGEDFVVVYVQ